MKGIKVTRTAQFLLLLPMLLLLSLLLLSIFVFTIIAIIHKYI